MTGLVKSGEVSLDLLYYNNYYYTGKKYSKEYNMRMTALKNVPTGGKFVMNGVTWTKSSADDRLTSYYWASNDEWSHLLFGAQEVEYESPKPVIKRGDVYKTERYTFLAVSSGWPVTTKLIAEDGGEFDVDSFLRTWPDAKKQ